jgi:sulfate transport system permease protein
MMRFGLPKVERSNVIPGFGMTLGFTLTYLSLIVLLPLSTVLFETVGMGWKEFARIATDARTLHALWLSFGTALVAALVNGVFGTLIAWVLVRYDFPGRKVIDAVVDLPFALPTAVAGIALTALYSENGWIGSYLEPLGIKVAYTPVGIIVALVFVGLPFVVRSVQPVLEDLDLEVEEAAATLGATRGQAFRRVVLPVLLPSLLTGVAMAFARGVGEYGSVIFIAGNIPLVSEIAPLLIVIRLEEFHYAGATALAAMMLGISFSILLGLNTLQSWSRKRMGGA